MQKSKRYIHWLLMTPIFIVGFFGSTSQVAIADSEVGSTDTVIEWPLVAVSMASLPDGRILTYSGSERRTWPTTERTFSAVWDPQTNQFTESLFEGHNMFCGALSMTDDGGVFVSGGRNQRNSPWTSLFDFETDEWRSLENMASGGRWYATTLAMGDGKILSAMGSSSNVRNPDLWSSKDGWRVLNGIDFINMRQRNNERGRQNAWPLLSLMPNGNIYHFWDTVENHAVSVGGNGSSRQLNDDTDLQDHAGGVQVFYDAGKILLSGNNDGSWSGRAISKKAFTVDLNGATPVIRATGEMNFPRAYHQLIPLPTGEVLVVGGNTTGSKFQDNGSVFETEIWNPETGQWRVTASLAVPRDYHSTALLMTDGRVITAGGGYHPSDPSSGGTHQDAQIYNPPYLYDGASLADRPTLSALSTEADNGTALSVTTTGDIDYFSMIKLSSTTHAVNTDARFFKPQFASTGTNSFDVTVHENPNIATPGYWMLFAVDTSGVPSVAEVVKVTSIALRKENLAIFGEASQSSTYTGQGNFSATNAIDGNLAGSDESNSLTHTENDLNAWWQLDLKRNIDIDTIRLWNRTDCCTNRLRDVSLFVSSQPFVSTDIEATRSQPGVIEYNFVSPRRQRDISVNAVGRYVRVQLNGQNFLSLAEVEVFGERPSYPNIANTGTVSQSSTLSNDNNFEAAKAVDGNTSGDTTAPVPSIGGDGGAAFSLACPAGQVLVGMYGAYETYVNGVGARCVAVNATGQWVSSPQDASSTGNPTTGTAFSQTCPSDYAISGFTGRSGQYVDQVSLRCQPLMNDSDVGGAVVTLPAVGGNGGFNQGINACSGKAALGLSGRSGGWMDVFALQCPASGGSITSTNDETHAWWQIDLGAVTTIDSVALWNRTDCCTEELSDVHVFVSNDPFSSTDPDTTKLQNGVEDFYQPGELGRKTEIIVGGTGRYLRVQLDGTNNLSLSEVEIYGVTASPLSVQSYEPEPIEASLEADFNAVATGNGLTYSWSFGDGTTTPFSSDSSASHTYTEPGRYLVSYTVNDIGGEQETRSFTQVVHGSLSSERPSASTGLIEHTNTGHVWNVNPDNDSVSVLDLETTTLLAEIAVGDNPRSLAEAPNGEVWIVNKHDYTISVVDPESFLVTHTIELTPYSQPHGIVFGNNSAYVALEAVGEVIRIAAGSRSELARTTVGDRPRHVSVAADGSRIYVTRFITPLLPGEHTATPVVDDGTRQYGGVVEVLSPNLNGLDTIILAHSDRIASEHEGPGIPNYLGPAVLSPDGRSAWVPSKQDNILAGALRGGAGMTFDQTVRAVTSHIDLDTGTADVNLRIDHDNSSVANHAAFGPFGVTLFTALEGNRQIAINDVNSHAEIARFNVEMAPQSIFVSDDGKRLYVHNYMSRTVGIYDVSDVTLGGGINAVELATVPVVTNESLSAQVLRGKQLFNDARDDRLAALDYMSCASCHNDGGHDGRVWDFTGLGEGLRNTITLKGRGGMAHGMLHWSSNFDELQDFEDQIREFAGGTGLMPDADYASRSTALGTPKAGVSEDLDALAAYMSNLTAQEKSPYKSVDGELSDQAATGRTLFDAKGCGTCHTGTTLTDSVSAVLHDIGTLKSTSGDRLGASLSGIDTPTLLGVWNTAPYLHDGSALDLQSAISAHSGISVTATELAQLEALLLETDNGDQFQNLADADADGVADINDAFPDDPSEYKDTDGDGVGDNSDAFANDPNETSDIDGDGVGDNADAFPNNPDETMDSDGDGAGDNSDAFPNDPNETTDSDGDGIGDNADGDLLTILPGASRSSSSRDSEWIYYLIENPDNVESTVVNLTGMTEDNDLYIRVGQRPTLSEFSCRSWQYDTHPESCEIDLNSGEPTYIGVFGFEASGFKLTLNDPSHNTDPMDLVAGVIVPGETLDATLDQGEWLYLKVDNPIGDTDTLARLFNLQNDIDLYIQYDALPTRAEFACRSFLGSNAEERCQIDLSSGRTPYIGAFGYRDSPFSLSLGGSSQGGGDGNIVTIEPGQSVSGSFVGAEVVYYEVDNPDDVALALVALKNITTDMDLFTREGSPPTSSVYDCMSALSSTQRENCSADLAGAAGTVYIGIQSYGAGTFELSLSDLASGEGDNFGEIHPGDSLNGDLIADQWMYYQVSDLAGLTNIKVDLVNLRDDLDLFVKYGGGLPTTTDYDCVSQAAGADDEQCEIVPDASGIVIVGVFGVDDETFTINLTADELIAGAANGDTPAGIRMDDSEKVHPGKWNYHEFVINGSEESLEVSVSNAELPVELYLRQSSHPTLEEFDCGPYGYTEKENFCKTVVSSNETWYVGVFSELGTSYDLRVATEGSSNTTTDGSTTDGSTTSGETTSGSTTDGQNLEGSGQPTGLVSTGTSGSSGGGTLLLLLSLLLAAIWWRLKLERVL